MKYKNIIFGCQMNVHESEKLAGMLEVLGYEPTDVTEEADVVVVNTCCIRDTAEKKAFGNIGALKPIKKQKNDMIIVVCGCMTEQVGYDQIFKTKYPFVDIVLGTNNINRLPEMILEKRRNVKAKFYENVSNTSMVEDALPITRTSFPNAWVNIMYGCNNFCSYCIVPYVRGRERSRLPQEIIAEVEGLIVAGYKEITLLGQNVNSYGNDFQDKTINFAYILDKVASLSGKFRIRFMTSHPKDLTQEIVDTIKAHDNICNNIHLPVQSGSNAVLAKMNRRYTREHYFDIIDMIRKCLPDCGITTDIMVGFPEETEQDFLDSLDLVKRVKFSNAFTFIYSMRKGTKAVEMEQVDSKTKHRRIAELIKIQNDITEEQSKTYLGKTEEILVEDVYPKKAGFVCGRTNSGRLVTFKGDKDLIGQFVNVIIEKTHAAALSGKIEG